jgi:hypothetical protein
MVFNNVTGFQQQAGASSHSQSVGRIFPNYYQEPLEFHPNSDRQYNSIFPSTFITPSAVFST